MRTAARLYLCALLDLGSGLDVYTRLAAAGRLTLDAPSAAVVCAVCRGAGFTPTSAIAPVGASAAITPVRASAATRFGAPACILAPFAAVAPALS